MITYEIWDDGFLRELRNGKPIRWHDENDWHWITQNLTKLEKALL